MTISSTTTKNSYSGNGSATAFNYTFFIPTNTDIQVIVRSSTGTETVKSEGTGSTNYSISGVGSASGGTVTFVTAPTASETVVLRRSTAKTQATDYVANDPFPAESHESALDKLTIIGQDLQEQIDRSIKLSRTNTMTSTEFTVGSTDRANKILAFDSSGEISVTQELGSFKGNWAASTDYVGRDIVKDTSTNNIFIVNTAHTSSGSQPLTSNANSAKYDLLVDASSATTSQTAAASSATAAASSASTASTQASNAASSATAAASSATSSAASFDSFDDRYLGAKSSEPSVDNDGDALITGALFFDTTAGATKVWTGSAWQTVTVSASNQTNINAVATNASNINAVAGKVTEIGLLGTSDAVADMALLGTSDVIADMALLATTDVIADMNTLATSDIISDLNTLATSDIVSDLNTLATSDVVTDMNTLATSSNVTNMDTVATNIANVNTVASANSNISTVAGANSNIATVASNISGVNSFADRYRVGSSDPSSSLDEGDLFYNSTSNVLKYYNGSAWTNIESTDTSNLATKGFSIALAVAL